MHLMRVFDWNKAAEIIKNRGLENASAGLQGDYGNTKGIIFQNSKPCMDDYTYLASAWAVPMLLIPNDDGTEEEIPCYIMANETDWNGITKWPQSALDILTNGVEEFPLASGAEVMYEIVKERWYFQKTGISENEVMGIEAYSLADALLRMSEIVRKNPEYDLGDPGVAGLIELASDIDENDVQYCYILRQLGDE